MSLPACQQRVLDTIENTLQRREPRLASMFAMFTRLNTNEGIPRTERLAAAPWWAWRRQRRSAHLTLRAAGRDASMVRAMLLVPLVVMAMMSIMFLGMATSRPSCTPATGPHGPVTIQSHPQGCRSGQVLWGSGHGR
jgi:hypothetical protein